MTFILFRLSRAALSAIARHSGTFSTGDVSVSEFKAVCAGPTSSQALCHLEAREEAVNQIGPILVHMDSKLFLITHQDEAACSNLSRPCNHR